MRLMIRRLWRIDWGWRDFIKQHLGKTAYGKQNIVQVMGNTTGKCANGLHFLRLPELIFKKSLFRFSFFTCRNVLQPAEKTTASESPNVQFTFSIRADPNDVTIYIVYSVDRLLSSAHCFVAPNRHKMVFLTYLRFLIGESSTLSFLHYP